jgi:hypothetical protein
MKPAGIFVELDNIYLEISKDTAVRNTTWQQMGLRVIKGGAEDGKG